MTTQPIWFTWDGDAMQPLPRFHNVCNAQYVVGETYQLEEYYDRSQASHGHQFAWLHDAWMNLPETLQPLYPSPEHLRKRALVDAGFYTEQIIDAGTNAAALRVAAGIRKREEFSVVLVRGGIVVIRTPESQSKHAMGGKRFQESKTAIMDVIAALLGVAPADLAKAQAA